MFLEEKAVKDIVESVMDLLYDLDYNGSWVSVEDEKVYNNEDSSSFIDVPFIVWKDNFLNLYSGYCGMITYKVFEGKESITMMVWPFVFELDYAQDWTSEGQRDRAWESMHPHKFYKYHMIFDEGGQGRWKRSY